jgi:hypothetical protein
LHGKLGVKTVGVGSRFVTVINRPEGHSGYGSHQRYGINVGYDRSRFLEKERKV